MNYRVHPFWWPVLGLMSPVLAPAIAARTRTFRKGRARARDDNRERLDTATQLELPQLESLEIVALVEQRAAPGFLGEAGVSYLLKSDCGQLLFDLGFGPGSTTFGHNWHQLGLSMQDVDAVAISHLHLDHMGGGRAQRRKQVLISHELRPVGELKCFVPDTCTSPFFSVERLDGPALLPAGLASTGPLAAMLFFFGYTREQSLIANIKGKGLVLVVGCGHPTLPVILSMVRRVSRQPIYAVVGGLHLPLTGSRLNKLGVQLQRILGTGKMWNDPIDDEDMDVVVSALNEAKPQRVLFSLHDSCDRALERLDRELDAQVEALQAGQIYTL